MTAPSNDALFEFLSRDEAGAIDRLVEWLAIPSVGTDPAYNSETRKAGTWLRDQFKAIGIDAELRETGTEDAPGHPIVWAEHPGSPDYDGPHVLFYGHYDVQPTDPDELWDSPPFEPVILEADGQGDVPQRRVVARGAVDDKGQVATFLEACRAWHAVHGSIPVKVTLMIEGEEESGSANLVKFVDDNRAQLERCDIAVISDTGMLGRGKPAITTGVRGILATEIVLHGPNQDLHSGQWGGRCPNPLNELTKVLGSLWDSNRRCTIPGFYDHVLPLDPADRERWKALPVDYQAQRESIGIPASGDVGEAEYSALEREWARPTAEINGISGGYAGDGFKTVIPTHATAKVSFRLVANQDPAGIFDAWKDWLDQNTPEGCSWTVIDHGGGFPGNVASDSPYVQASVRALGAAEPGVDPFLIKTGGSIPVVGLLKERLNLDTLLIGFGLDDDRVHSPNEKFEIPCFTLGCRTHAALLSEWVSWSNHS